MVPKVLRRQFGRLPTGELVGELVEAFTLTNSCGASAEILTYGGVIAALRVPDRDGRIEDVVLGFDTLYRYIAGNAFFGAITGRVAGRITGACFTLEDRTYKLACNHPPNHLHGGRVGFDKRLWAAHPCDRADGAASLRLTYHSPDGEEGYPGAVDVAVTYTLTATNELIIDTEAISDRATPFSLTNHSYFNLAGEAAGTIADHTLQIYADAFASTDENMTLLGRRVPVAGRPNDFNQGRRIGDALPHLFQHHGDLYLVRRSTDLGDDARTLVLVARVSEPRSGRVLTVSTTEPCLQFYTGVALDSSLVGKSGRPYGPYAGLCLECEGYPDAVNTPGFGDIVIRPGRPQRTRTVYAFLSMGSP